MALRWRIEKEVIEGKGNDYLNLIDLNFVISLLYNTIICYDISIQERHIDSSNYHS